ncbi:MAG: Plug domain-containing protein, partial [Sphingomonadales bacterium]|nr:Plug domain-containing protein [Sphingomonadales bacterium]
MKFPKKKIIFSRKIYVAHMDSTTGGVAKVKIDDGEAITRMPLKWVVLASTYALAAAAPGYAQAQDEARPNAEPVEVIVITATRRSERVTDVPISVQAVAGSELKKLGAVNFADYARTVAGISFLDFGPGRSQIFVRGVSTGGDIATGKEATVGVYLDEVPISEGSSQPDLKLFDINR